MNPIRLMSERGSKSKVVLFLLFLVSVLLSNCLTVVGTSHKVQLSKCIYYLLIGDVPRVNGQLAVARAFGDQSLKAHLSSEPDFKHVPINSSIEFAILASDGLWKVCALLGKSFAVCYLL
jgi:hypothetical protein